MYNVNILYLTKKRLVPCKMYETLLKFVLHKVCRTAYNFSPKR